MTSYASSEVNSYYGNTYSLDRVAVEGAISGISSELHGGNFWEGFEVGAGLGMMRYYYNKTMKYDVTWEEGHDLASENGTYKESLGVPQDKQVFGTNDPLNENGEGNFWKQGGALSNVSNKIPGMNSLARLHDYYQIGFGSPSSWMRTWFNVPAMIPATVVNYGALIQTLPNYPTLFQRRATDKGEN